MQKLVATKMLKRAVLFALLIGLSMVTVVSAATIGIDNFNDPQEVCIPTTVGCPLSQSAVTTTNALGGFRTATVTRTAGTNAVTARSADTSDYFSYSAGNFTQGTLELVWDGNNNPATIDYAGLGGVDLTDGATNNGIYFREVYNDLEFTLRVEIYTDANNWSFGNITIPAGQSGVNFNIPFASFAQGGGAAGPANLANVGAVRLLAGSGISALDFSIDYMAADSGVPTAVTLANANAQSQTGYLVVLALVGVFGLGLLSFATVQKRR